MKSLYSNITVPSLDTQLIVAVQTNNEALVKQLLVQGASATYNNSDALQWAARNGNSKIVQLLLDAGADPAADNDNAINWAEHQVDIYQNIAKMLLTSKYKKIMDYSEWEYFEENMLKFQNPKSIDYITQIDIVLHCLSKGYYSILDYLKGKLRIHITGMLIKFLEYSLERDNYDKVMSNFASSIKYLVDNGADVNININGQTPLELIINFFYSSIATKAAKYLIDHGENIHANDDRALKLAARNGYREIVKSIVEHDGSPDINLANKALKYINSLNSYNSGAIRYLVSIGVDPNLLTAQQRREYGVKI